VATELRPRVFEALFTRLAARSAAAGAAALTSLALAIEREAKLNLGKSSHRYGTRSPASVGGPPALISGTLRRSVTHSKPVVTEIGAEVRVGLAVGFYPPYGKGRKTPANKYGYYLETGQLHRGRQHGPSGAYPFLHPAFRKVVAGGDVGRFVAAGWRST
jgi:hypothetical protein